VTAPLLEQLAPGAELIGPCRVMLRTAQAFRFIGRIGGGDRTVGPRQSALAGLVKRALRTGRNGQNAGCALNHNVARIGRSRPHQGDPTTPRLDLRAHPFGAATGLAKSHAPPLAAISARILGAAVVRAERDSANRIRTPWLRQAPSRGSARRPRLLAGRRASRGLGHADVWDAAGGRPAYRGNDDAAAREIDPRSGA
jgi:hypothetical protein